MKNTHKGFKKIAWNFVGALLFFGVILGSVAVYADSDTVTKPSLPVSNAAPTVDYVDDPPTQTLTEAGEVNFTIYASITDTNGVADITSANVSVSTAAGDTTGSPRVNASCVDLGDLDADTANFSCTIVHYWADEPGTWTVNVTGIDASSAVGSNTTQTYTINTLDAVNVTQHVEWTTPLTAGSDNNAADNHLILNATGNKDYDIFNITGYNFVNESDIILVGNVTVDEDNGFGSEQTLVNATAVTVTSATITAGYDSSSAETIYHRADIPSGTASKTYYSLYDWTVLTDHT